MALKRLPNDIQSLLCASTQINSYKRAIEELVYNSLDAESTSIAIRIHIEESTIQVIDNGYGVLKHDFNSLGQRYMTSKITDMRTLKAAPKSYGYRGEFLANIIAISQMVKITSRHEKTEETWAKTFHNGKEMKFAKMSTRPTKGTTVDVKGFLYNLNIQKKAIHPIEELQNVKSFLEQLSLVHNNISLSLRDDSKNEIVFKIHKKRDVYQTLTTLFNISMTDIVELQIEKHEYKVKGLIGKCDKNIDLHWIYLNRKFIHGSSKIHKTINEYFKKSLLIKDQRKLKSKTNNDEHELFNQSIPFYFIFVKCPYIDYNISFTSKQSVIEFKNWGQINKLLEKLVKFYVGDANLKELKKPESKLVNKEQTNVNQNQDTRNQVKRIMDKILGSNSRKLGVSQLQNGVKGKLVKRKTKKKPAIKSANILTLLRQNDEKSTFNNNHIPSPKSKIESFTKHNSEEHIQKLPNDLNQNADHNKLSLPKPHNKVKKTDTNRYKLKDIPGRKKKIKAKILPSTKKTTKIFKHKNRLNKHKRLKINPKKAKLKKQLEETDSIYKKSKIVAQKAEDFLQHYTKKKKTHITQKEKAISKVYKNICLRRKYDNAIQDNIPLPRKINQYIIDKYVMNKLKTKPYKTTYDLVRTILIGQQEGINAETKNTAIEGRTGFSNFDYIQNETSLSIRRVPKTATWTNKYTFNKYANVISNDQMSTYPTTIPIKHDMFEYKDHSEYSGVCGQKRISDFIPSISKDSEVLSEDIHSVHENINYRQNEATHHTLRGPMRLLTYDSHQYQRNYVFETNDTDYSYSINKGQKLRFITKQSRDTFVTSNDLRSNFKRPTKSTFNRQTKTNDLHMRQTIDESSYTIDYTKSYENNNYNFKAHSDILEKISAGYVKQKNYPRKFNEAFENYYDHEIPVHKTSPVFGNTYTIRLSNFSSGIDNIVNKNQTENQYTHSHEVFDTYSINYSNSEANVHLSSKIKTKDDYSGKRNNFNIVFVSKPQYSKTENLIDSTIHDIEPLNVCETILHESETMQREFAFSFNGSNRLNDSLYENFQNIDVIDGQTEKEPLQIATNQGENDITGNVSHHFSNVVNTKQPLANGDGKLQDPMTIDDILPNFEDNFDVENIDFNFDTNNFNLKNRPRFLPKGMSQIFENCRSKTACDFNLEEDYYEDSIYNNFANYVQVNAEIYEPIIQNVEDLTTKNIHKFQNKVKKDNASLVFDENSLKEAAVLGQADCKFIAVIMKKRCRESKDAKEYLVLFDQHAVHERIRLEKNLKDYIKEDKWTSVPLDNITLQLSKDDILYLHNYKDKFTQLGLQWTISDENEVTVNSIPVAILGKNPREVEKVIKAVRNLIIEEINVIKIQKGCMSLYPKSIMDLIFSEACRYAIKFGDQLSKNDCVELLKSLSDCKTPFQCAHGRPVMAVLMDIKCDKREYKINMEKLSRFKP